MTALLFFMAIAGIVAVVTLSQQRGRRQAEEPSASEGVFVFRFHGQPFSRIYDPPMAIMAEQYRDACLSALEPVRQDVERLGGRVIIDLKDYMSGVQLRIQDLNPQLEQRVQIIISEVKKPMPPIGTSAYVKREVKEAQAMRKRSRLW